MMTITAKQGGVSREIVIPDIPTDRRTDERVCPECGERISETIAVETGEPITSHYEEHYTRARPPVATKAR
jgi:hypothetical protein